MRHLRSILPALATFLLSQSLPAQTTTYTAPSGLFTVQVPAGWRAHYEPDLHQVSLSSGPLLAIVMVTPQNKSNALTPAQFLETTADDFSHRCPTYQAVQNGDVSLAGHLGQYSLFTCSDPKSPAVAETSAALTATPTLIAVTLIAPLSDYADNLPTLDAIRDSVRLTGQPAPHVPSPKDTALAELKKACRVGAFPQIECARRLAILDGDDYKPSDNPATSASIYHDARNRFTVTIPKSWRATPEGDNGSLGVQLRLGDSFINIMPAPPAAATTDEVVLQQEQKFADLSQSPNKPPFGSVGIIQIFGNGVEVSYDNFRTSSAKGIPIDSYVAGVGDISGKGAFLLVIASLQPATAGGTFLATAQSIHLLPH
jgi:hypothetical protein